MSPALVPSYLLYTDGGARGNPGPAAAAFVVFDKERRHLYTGGAFLGPATNNVAEYQGVILALKYISTLHSAPCTLHFSLDSKLVAEQLAGHFKIRDSHLLQLALQVSQLLSEYKLTATFTHIPRAQNAQADTEVNRILDAQSALALP